MDADTLLNKLDRIDDIPTLPTIVLELNKLLQDPDTPITEVADIIEKDQSIALKILKLVNSAFYGIHSKVSDISGAIIMLGFKSVQNAILSLSVIKSFSKRSGLHGFDITEFWKHSLAVAVTSKSLAQKSRKESPDNCFVAGLLHDIGKVILAQYFQDLFEKIWSTAQQDTLSFYDAEKKVSDIDHGTIGAHLAGNWQLPVSLIDAIKWHHEFKKDIENYNLLMIIYLSNIVVNSYDEDPECAIDISAMHPAAVKFMMDQLENIQDWYSSLANDIETAYQFFLE
jgi:putative nucleotidyltransferase with HDIG domain